MADLAAAGCGAAVGGGMPVCVGDGDAPGGGRVAAGLGGEGAGQAGVDGAVSGGFAGVAGEAEQGGQRDGQRFFVCSDGWWLALCGVRAAF